MIFPDRVGAQWRRPLDALDDEGALTLFAAAVLVKDAEGKISVEDKQQPGPLGLGPEQLQCVQRPPESHDDAGERPDDETIQPQPSGHPVISIALPRIRSKGLETWRRSRDQ